MADEHGPARRHSILDVAGLRVGHFTNAEAGTGCTVILCENGAVAAGEVRGSAPGTRETDLLRPGNLVERVDAILLTGGSAFGLDAAGGVMRYLHERGIGFDAGPIRIPIVPAAVIFDLGLGRSDVWPDAEAGYSACIDATDIKKNENDLVEGSIGAGTGATIGKVLGPERATKGGIGSSAVSLADGVVVAALFVVNAIGEVVNPRDGKIVAGARGDGAFVEATSLILHPDSDVARRGLRPGANTTIGVVATNATLSRQQMDKVVRMAHDGLARATRPSHTLYDGDTIFGLATGAVGPADTNQIGVAAAEAASAAIVRAAVAATGLHGIPAATELPWAAAAHALASSPTEAS